MVSGKISIQKADNTYGWYVPLSTIAREDCTSTLIRKADNTYRYKYAPLSAIAREDCTIMLHVPRKNKEIVSSRLSMIKIEHGE
jgi:hypothetical protein